MLKISFKLNFPLHNIHARISDGRRTGCSTSAKSFVLGKVMGIVTIYGFGTEIFCIIALIQTLEMFLHAFPLLPNLDKPLM